MPGSGKMFWLALGVLATIAVSAVPVFAGTRGPVLLADRDGENIDLAVRQVTVTPVRAHVGDVIHVNVVIENKSEGARTTPAEMLVNGRPVAMHLFTWGNSDGDRLYRLSFEWNTRGVRPGSYRIGARAFVWEDSSPFDNELTVTKPVVIAPVGGAFPGGEVAGGSATETDPRWTDTSAGG